MEVTAKSRGTGRSHKAIGMVRGIKIAEISRPKSLTDHAYQKLREAFRSGSLEPHRFYPLGDVAQAFGISRTPVREAVLKLAHDGLLEILPQRGFRIREIGPEEAAEVFELRNLLEGRTVEKLARKASEADVERLQTILKRQQRLLGDAARFLDVDEEFHLTMLDLAGFHRAREFFVTLRDVIWLLLGFEALSAPGRLEDVIAEHRQIVEAIERHNAPAARAAINAHLETTYARIRPDGRARANQPR